MRIVSAGTKIHPVTSLVKDVPAYNRSYDNQNFKRINILKKCPQNRDSRKSGYCKFIRNTQHKLVGCRMKKSLIKSLTEVGS